MEPIEVVRSHCAAYEGVDLIPIMSETLDHAENTNAAERERLMQEDPAWSLTAPGIQIRLHIFPDLDVFSGWEGVIEYWARWLEMWESYTYEMESHRDLGNGSVLSVVRVQAKGRGGIPVATEVFELRRVHEGLVVAYEAFGSEQEVLQAAQHR